MNYAIWCSSIKAYSHFNCILIAEIHSVLIYYYNGIPLNSISLLQNILKKTASTNKTMEKQLFRLQLKHKVFCVGHETIQYSKS